MSEPHDVRDTRPSAKMENGPRDEDQVGPVVGER